MLSQEIKETLDESYMNHVRSTAQDVAFSIEKDIDYQVSKFGAQRTDVFNWIAIITEEFGETVQHFLKKEYDQSIAEAKQTIACLSRMITEIEREQSGTAQREADLYERAK